MWFISFLFSLILFGVLTILIMVVFRKKRSLFDALRIPLYAVFFLLAFTLYYIGVWQVKVANNPNFNDVFYTLVQSVSGAVRAFVLIIDRNAVEPYISSHQGYAFFFYLTHVVIFALVEVFVVDVFGKTIYNFFLRMKMIYLAKKRIYLFGKSENVFAFIDDYIATNKHRKNDLFVVYDNAWTVAEIERLRDNVICSYALKAVNQRLLDKIGIHKIHLSSLRETKVILLYENDQTTLEYISLIRHFINDSIGAKNDISFDVFAQITKMDQLEIINSDQRLVTLNDEEKTLDGRISFFNTHDLCAHEFIRRYDIFDFMNEAVRIDTKKAKLANPEAMDISFFFVGFGSLGQELFRQVYANYQLLNARFDAHIIDKESGFRYHELKRRCPTLFEEVSQNLSKIRFAPECTVASDTFTNYIEDYCQRKSNVFFVALGSDMDNVENGFIIKSLLDQKVKLGMIERADVFFYIVNRTGYIHHLLERLENMSSDKVRIHFIGDHRTLYTYQKIVMEDLDMLSIRVDRAYLHLNKTQLEKYEEVAHDETKLNQLDHLTWSKRNAYYKESNRFIANNLRTKLRLLGLNLVEKQTFLENSGDYKVITGNILFKDDFSLVDDFTAFDNEAHPIIERFLLNIRANSEKYRFLRALYDKDIAATNLAKNEAQRWNAFHLISGWQSLPVDEVYTELKDNKLIIRNKEIESMRHLALTSWEDLITNNQKLYRRISDTYKLKDERIKEEILYTTDYIKSYYFLVFSLFSIVATSNYLIVEDSNSTNG